MKRIQKAICLALFACFSLAILSACAAKALQTPAATAGLTYISLRINPEIELISDCDGVVVGANAVNYDGEVVLCELDPIGMTAEEAAQAFTETATALGYIDPESEDNTVYVDVQDQDADKSAALCDKIMQQILSYFESAGISGNVSLETLEKYLDKVTQWGVGTGQVKLILRVLELYPELSVEQVLALDFQELAELIKQASRQSTADLQNQFQRKVEEIKANYLESLAPLEQCIAQLEAEMRNPELTEEQLAALTEKYQNALSRKEELENAYIQALRQSKLEYREQIADIKLKARKEARERKQRVEELLEQAQRKDKANRINQKQQMRQQAAAEAATD